jgi:hypothetical protein
MKQLQMNLRVEQKHTNENARNPTLNALLMYQMMQNIESSKLSYKAYVATWAPAAHNSNQQPLRTWARGKWDIGSLLKTAE